MSFSEFFVLRRTDSDETVELAGASFLVGRDADCDIRVDDPRVSRRHARLLIARGELGVEDLGSANGTRVNGRGVRRRHRLASGDVLTLGDVSFLVIAPQVATGMTVVSSRLPERAGSFVEAESEGGDTLVSQPYSLPPGWTDIRKTAQSPDLEAAERQLSRLLLRLRPAPGELAAVLLGVGEPFAGELFELHSAPGQAWLLGRGSDCDLRLDNATISRRHAHLARGAHGWMLIDLGTTNGCAVNDEPVQGQAALKRGDLLHLGAVSLLFRPLDP